MDKDTIKILLTEYQRKVVDIELIERSYEIEDTFNYVCAGLRRVGK
jgi:hypothetical protein